MEKRMPGQMRHDRPVNVVRAQLATRAGALAGAALGLALDRLGLAIIGLPLLTSSLAVLAGGLLLGLVRGRP